MKITNKKETPKIILFYHLKKGDTFMIAGSSLVFIKIYYGGDKALSLGSGDIITMDSSKEVFPCDCELIVSK